MLLSAVSPLHRRSLVRRIKATVQSHFWSQTIAVAVCTKLLESNRKFLTISDRRRISASTRLDEMSVRTQIAPQSTRKLKNLEKIAQKTSANALLTLRLRVAQLSEIYALMKTWIELPHEWKCLFCLDSAEICANRFNAAEVRTPLVRNAKRASSKIIDSRHDARLVPDRCCPNTIAGIAVRQTNWHLAGHVKHNRGR